MTEHAAMIARAARLLAPIAPSGFEYRAGDAFAEVARELGARDVTVDAGGNHVAWFGSPDASIRRMLTAHVDEIGFLVSRIDQSGLLRCDPVGGWDRSVVLGQRVRIAGSGPEGNDGDHPHCHGVTCRAAIHTMTQVQAAKSPSYTDLWIDIGVASADEAARFVRVGDPLVIESPMHTYPSGRLMARALDDRIGVLACLEAAARCTNDDVECVVLGAGTEEIGGFGAMVGTYAIAPGEAIAIDVVPTTDVPDSDIGDIGLGNGPVVTFGAVVSQRIARELLALAEEREIPVQLEAAGSTTGTDTEAVVRAGAGVATGLVSIPTRNLHMPAEICDMGDVDQVVELVAAWLSRPV